MRACSAWPSGIWMDGPKRTVPDGSSFAWQHWSHTFEYALASGSGDWRTAGFPVAGQEYSHRLLACETDLHAGPLPAAHSLASVAPAGVRPDGAQAARQPAGARTLSRTRRRRHGAAAGPRPRRQLLIHSVDSLKLLERIDRVAGCAGRRAAGPARGERLARGVEARYRSAWRPRRCCVPRSRCPALPYADS